MADEDGIIAGNLISRVKRLGEPETEERHLNYYSDDEEEWLMMALAADGEHVVALAGLGQEEGSFSLWRARQLRAKWQKWREREGMSRLPNHPLTG
jgi:hypothetical protein